MPSLLQHFISSYQLLAPKTSPFIRSHSMDSVFLGFGNCRFPYDLISLIDLRSLIDFQFIFFFPLLWGCDSLFVCMLSRFSHIWLIAILWTIARQAPLSIGFSRQEYWSGLPWPPPRDLPNPWLELHLPLLRCRWILYHWVTEGSMVDYLHALYISHLNLGVWQFFNTSMRLHFLIFYEPEKVKWLQSSPTPEKSWRVLSGKKDIIINFLVALIWAHKFFEMLDNLNARDLQNSISLFILMKESFLGIQVFQCQI